MINNDKTTGFPFSQQRKSQDVIKKQLPFIYGTFWLHHIAYHIFFFLKHAGGALSKMSNFFTVE